MEGANVVGCSYPRVAGQLRAELADSPRRLVGKYIKTSAKVGAVERSEQRGFIDHLASAGVDEHRVGLHGRQEVGIYHSGGAFAARHVQRHDVARRQQGSLIGDLLYPDVGHALAHLSRSVGPGFGDDTKATGAGPLSHFDSDGPHADDSQRGPEQPSGLAVRLLVPVPGSEIGGGGGDVAVNGKHQPDGQLSHRNGVAARDVAHKNPQLCGPVGVDGVGPRPGPNHEAELVGGFQSSRSDLGAAHHQHIESGNVLGQALSSQRGIDHAIVAPGPQTLNGAFRQAVSKEDSHEPDSVIDRRAIITGTIWVPLLYRIVELFH